MGSGLPSPAAVRLARASSAGAEGAAVSAYEARYRKPGAPVLTSGELAAFLRMNPEERFDLEAINVIDLEAVLEEARTEKRLLREVLRTAKALMPRVRAETEKSILVGAILRRNSLAWYRRSPTDPSWVRTMPVRWGGIFFESREPGGRLSRGLSARLISLSIECVKASGRGALLSASVSGLLRSSAGVSFRKGSKRPRGPRTQIVAQAFLDDLAATARNGDQPLPLERLSDLARRIGSADVNRTLGELFPQDGAQSLTVLDQRFHPGMNGLRIRVVPPKSSEDAATYDLIQVNAHLPDASDALDDPTAEPDAGSHWDRQHITKEDWFGVLRSLKQRKARLDPPPRENYRERESYLELRELILMEPKACRTFRAVHWKGKPSGLILLSQLLADGTFAPDVDTDGDYLEAELDHIHEGHARRRPEDGQWKIGQGWTVVREIAEGNVRTYVAGRNSKD